MATIIGVCNYLADLSQTCRLDVKSASGKLKRNPILKMLAMSSTEKRDASVSTATRTTEIKTKMTRSFVEKKRCEEDEREMIDTVEVKDEYEGHRKSLIDCFEEAKHMMIRSNGDQPGWFTPLDCACSYSPLDSPLLLYLPGIDGVGLGLKMQHHTLGKIFEISCLHIPVKDRTSFIDLVKIIERKVRSEKNGSPNRPIYLVGESLGACLALAVAARNPHLNLVLILANPGTSYRKSVLQSTLPLLQLMPDQSLSFAFMSLMTDDPFKMAMDYVAKGYFLQPTVEGLSQNLPILADILPKETLLWKLELLRSASAYVNARLHAIKAQTLILCSGKDQLLPSKEEGQRLRRELSKCQTRSFDDSGHFLFLEDDVDLVTIIKGAAFYRRGKIVDYVSDFIPPTTSEFNRLCENNRWLNVFTSPGMFSTLKDGKIVRGLSGIPSEGPVLFVGYHMLFGIDVPQIVAQFMSERNILLRCLAHPIAFFQLSGKLPDIEKYDYCRLMGAVPVSGANLYKLLSSKSHVLLYPGGARESCHRKGEEYKLFWPEQPEFVRMAAQFGATIIPFGSVGEDDVAQIVLDYNDQMKIPHLNSWFEETMAEGINLRSGASGEVANQPLHMPICLPKVPGRFYYYFGKPIETIGRKHELRDKKKSHELYLQVKSDVDNCLVYLKEKRQRDPYRNLLPRLIYQTLHGFRPEVPTFKL